MVGTIIFTIFIFSGGAVSTIGYNVPPSPAPPGKKRSCELILSICCNPIYDVVKELNALSR